MIIFQILIDHILIWTKVFEKRKAEEQERFDKLLAMRGTENAYKLHRELGEIMTANVTVVRENEKLLETDEKDC